MPTDKIPEALLDAQEVDLLRYLDEVLNYGDSVLENTDLGWAGPALRQLLGEDDSPFRMNYAIAPASSSLSRHHCFPGGLMHHSLEVYFVSCCLWSGARGPTGRPLTPNDRAALWVTSLLHDLNKCCDPAGRPLYMDNILKKGERSPAKPWKRNPDFLKTSREDIHRICPPVDADDGERIAILRMLQIASTLMANETGRVADGKISYLLACSQVPEFSRLPQSIIQAIHYHDGGYGQARYELNGGEEKITIIIHAADMLSSRFEGGWAVDPISSLSQRVPRTPEELDLADATTQDDG